MYATTSSAGTSHATLPIKSANLAFGPCIRRVLAKQDAAPSVSTRASEKAEIYLGFKKDDYEPKEGRKGRVVVDDPKKYPDRDALTGGWSGGEVGLWQFRESIKEELKKKAAPEPKPKPDGRPAPGKAPIYVGFGKEPEDFKLKSKGIKGRVIYDDETKYPGREDVGPISSATGGFAGGERGLKAYVETGEVRLRKPGEAGGQPSSPLTLAFVLFFGGGVGGVLLSVLSDVGEDVVKKEVFGAPVDDSTKYLLLGAVVALGGALALGGAKVAVDSVQEKQRAAAQQLLAIFGAGFLVFVGARVLLEL